jgi:P2 family phage contractile tail tube protein
MPQTLYVLEAANMFCGDVDPSLSQHLTISEVKLPNMEENFVDHQAGGAPVIIEIDTILQRLECTFQLAGWSPQVASMIGSWVQQTNVFTMYGVIRDRRSGAAIEAKAILGGRLGRANPANWTRGALQHWDYSIRAVTHYELYVDGAELFVYDFFLNTFRAGGIDRWAEQNSILRIPTMPLPITA